jgi:glycosyltransferase involved in cell wall biosynthesis
LLEELAKAKGFVFLPPGGDTCPRIVIEAKLLGCDLVLNDYVQHAHESWFDTQDLDEVEEYLYTARELFWNHIKFEMVEKVPKLSGYTTTLNCVSQKYPFEQCIRSMLGFCDEVVVVDGGSTDGTLWKLWKIIEEFSEPGELSPELIHDMNSFEEDLEKVSGGMKDVSTKRIKFKRINRDWNDPRFAVFDGLQKAEARKLCTGDFCWQMDSDEIVHEDDYGKVRTLMGKFPKSADLVSLPVVEYWGGPEKVRLDVTPWKWRMSRNVPSITHGIPAALRKTDSNGQTYALPGTDGCDMINSHTGEPIPFVGFYSNEANQARMAALQGNPQALDAYQKWFQNVVDSLPGVHHFSWFDLERKIKTYKNYWGKHWQSLYDQSKDDTAENNMFFDIPWSEVTDQMIEDLAKNLSKNCGGWIWHRKWNGTNTPYLKLTTKLPESMLGFYDGRKR